jgi:hypothetical protein
MVEESVPKEYDEANRDFPGAYLGSGDDGAGGGENVGCVTVALLTGGSAPTPATCAVLGAGRYEVAIEAALKSSRANSLDVTAVSRMASVPACCMMRWHRFWRARRLVMRPVSP